MDSFSFQLNRAFQEEESPSTFYCISMQWFREWEGFVKGKDSGKLCSISKYGYSFLFLLLCSGGV